jgi:hypothetical protein
VIHRRRQEAHQQLVLDCFGVSGTPKVFPKWYFRRRIWMGAELFQHICGVVARYDTFFQQRGNCTSLLGHSILQKVTAAIRLMAYGIPADLVDDHLAMAESTTIYCLRWFAWAIIKCFGVQYLRAPNAQGYREDFDKECYKRVPRYAWLDWLHALKVEELFSDMAWTIYWTCQGPNNYPRGCYGPLDMLLACLLWNARIMQWYQCVEPITIVCKLSQWRSTIGWVWVKWAHGTKGYYLTDGNICEAISSSNECDGISFS